MSLLVGERIADDGIYLSEDRRKNTKDIFIEAVKIINNRKTICLSDTILDIGCATGEFIHYFKSFCPNNSFIGLDVSASLINEAKRRDPDSAYITGNIEDQHCFHAAGANVITMFGVLDCLDDPDLILNNLIKWTKNDGLILILDMFNNDPIDVLTRYKRADQNPFTWECGWNIHSKYTLSKILENHERVSRFEFKPFTLSIELPKKEDPMRTWTIKTENNSRQLINGASQLVNLEFIVIETK
ncbi:trans-aconitate 2-methyltransferase [Legionella sp. W05-934-2]|uniref:class I SAM-dependent methyltransferase n=1 Tax=Legionella sp. W05-934-2 TaxID=1198649 RepID=UPI003461D4CC